MESPDSTTSMDPSSAEDRSSGTTTDSSFGGGSYSEHGLTDFFQMLDRLAKVLRVYPRHHPVVQDVAARCVEQLTESVGDDPITVEFDASEIRDATGETIYDPADGETEEFLWYQAWDAGLRELSFGPDIDTDELRQLMRVVADSTERGSSSDDVVTRLWDLGLETISYGLSLADVEGGPVEAFDGRTPAEMVDVISEAATGDDDATRTLETRLDEPGLEFVSPVCRHQLGGARRTGMKVGTRKALDYPISVTDQRRRRHIDEWNDEGQLESRFLESMVALLDERPDSREAGRVADIIVEMALQMLGQGRYGVAHRLVEAVRRRQQAFDADVDPLEAIREQASDPQIVEGLLWRLQDPGEDDDNLFALMLLFDHEVVENQTLSILAGDDEPEDTALLYELLTKLAARGSSPLGYDDEFVHQPRLLKRLLEVVRNQKDRADSPVADAIVGAALESHRPETLIEILNLDLPHWDDPDWIEDRLADLVDHSDEQVRRRVYERLSDHPDLFEARVRTMIDNQTFGDRDAGELQFLFRQFADQTDNLELLRSCITISRGWLAGSAQEAMRAAARVLLQRGDDRAAELLRERANSLLTAPDLKRALRERLEFHGYDAE